MYDLESNNPSTPQRKSDQQVCPNLNKKRKRQPDEQDVHKKSRRKLNFNQDQEPKN